MTEQERIANVGAGVTPTYHATESAEEARAVVEQCMSATDELRRLLDERGVEWDYGITGAETTRFNANGLHLTFTPMRYGLVCSTILTPEQAVEATLGRGKCRNLSKYVNEFECSCCGWTYDFVTDPYSGPRYCPNCGRRVVD